ncbi:TPA: class II holin family protein [Escherichia coli]|nr:class II holin family protein [Escherichia coli]
MKSMDKLTTGVAYGTSAGSAGYWFLQLLDKVTPSQWAAIGVLGISGCRASVMCGWMRSLPR